MNRDELRCGESRYYDTGDDVRELRDKYNTLVEVVVEQSAILDTLVKDDALDGPEQLTLRDQFAVSVIPPTGLATRTARAVYRYLEADAMMEARKKSF